VLASVTTGKALSYVDKTCNRPVISCFATSNSENNRPIKICQIWMSEVWNV